MENGGSLRPKQIGTYLESNATLLAIGIPFESLDPGSLVAFLIKIIKALLRYASSAQFLSTVVIVSS